MFSVPILERLPSTWRMAMLQAILVMGSITLCVLMADWSLRRDLSRIARAVVLDDLGEYAVLYERIGLPGLAAVFAAGTHEETQAVRITTAAGDLVFEQIPPAVSGFSWPAKAPQEPKNGPALQNLAHRSDSRHLLAACQVLADGNVLWFGRTNAEDRAYHKHIRASLWLAGLGTALLSALPLWWFAVQVLEPVRQMRQAALPLSQGRTNVPIVARDAMPELKAFAEVYNQGLRRIEALTGELQNANENLAHDLRTPLARIRANLEVYFDATDHPEARDAAARSLDEIDRATRLVHSILTIRAGDHGALKLHRQPADLCNLLAQLRELYLPAAGQLGLALYLQVPDSLILPLDTQQVSQAVANLLDNALAYTPSGGTVGLALQLCDSVARISVSDSGPGLLSEEMERIWGRHVRGSASGRHPTGLGLGLSFVRAIAAAHGGASGCSNAANRGAIFWMDLPLRPIASQSGEELEP